MQPSKFLLVVLLWLMALAASATDKTSNTTSSITPQVMAYK